ncbi:hypothetical protein HY003_02015 [Candidatus Saccharibacteria bacterium]|nr:hypothetical protein [Candidatus Saccharibacteria bacterium]MBI3338051.1 hypothetical protein [Candidatus Saccharibacteria bacterium]
MTEGEVALATSREDRPLSAEISWSGDGGVFRQSGITDGIRSRYGGVFRSNESFGIV